MPCDIEENASSQREAIWLASLSDMTLVGIIRCDDITQEAKLSYVEAVDAVAQAEVLYRAQTKKELAVPVHYMGQTRM